jgi:hypothetical protein
MSIKHIVMWNVRGDDAAARAHNLARLKAEFESLRGLIPGLLQLEIGVDESRIDYACDVVLCTEFTSRQALRDYADHPEHLRVRRSLGDMRSARHQVDYEVIDPAGGPAAGPGETPSPDPLPRSPP